MHAIRRRKKLACVTTALAFFAMQCAPLQAGLLSTETVFEQAGIVEVDRARIAALLNTDQISQQLVALGVDPAQVESRLAGMTDAELAGLQGQLETLPAGGIDVLAAVLIVFFVLLATDIAGLTDVFPFVRKQ